LAPHKQRTRGAADVTARSLGIWLDPSARGRLRASPVPVAMGRAIVDSSTGQRSDSRTRLSAGVKPNHATSLSCRRAPWNDTLASGVCGPAAIAAGLDGLEDRDYLPARAT
jgi:hypothetical protein